MKNTHYRSLVLERTCLDNGAGQNFYQTASDGINNSADYYPHKRIRKYKRQKCKTDKSHSRQGLRQDRTHSVSDIFYQACANNINSYLRDKEHYRDHGYLSERYSEFSMKSEEQERRKIGRYRLRNERKITCCECS